jgi:hypothetical protein
MPTPWRASGRRPVPQRWHMAIAWLALSASAAFCEGDAPKLPLPPELLEARVMLQKIEKAKTLPDEAKEQAQAQLAVVEAQFTKVWEPIEALYAEAMAYRSELKIRDAEMKAKADAHNARPHVFTEKQQAEHQAYDAEAERLNAEQEQARREMEERNKAINIKWKELANPVDAWLKGPSLRDFKRTGQALLDGKVTFTKGMAWAQLTKAAGSSEAASQVMDHSDPNVVDATNVKPWTPEERAKELAKPRVQPLYRPKPPAPPPPVPPPAPAR